MILYLVRHGVPTVSGVRLGKLEVPLSKEGINQVKKVAKVIDGVVIYSSPITRARQTAEIIADEIGAKIIFRDELTARDQGEATGLTEEEVRKLKPKDVEPLENVEERAAKFLEEIIQKDEDAIIVTHKKVIQMMLSYILNIDPADALKFAVENAHFVKLRYNGYWKILSLNC